MIVCSNSQAVSPADAFFPIARKIHVHCTTPAFGKCDYL